MKHLFLILTFILSGSVFAVDTELDNINQDDLDAIGKEFAGNFAHNGVRPPIRLGDVFGLELGLVAGTTDTPEFNRLVQEQNPNANLKSLPHFGGLISASVPGGFTGEIIILPDLGDSNMTLSNTSFAIRWDAGMVFLGKSDLKLDAKFHMSSSSLAFTQVDGATTIGVNFDTSTMGVMATAGYDFFVFQPYLGLGFINASTEVGVTGGTIFDPSFTAGSNAESDTSSFHLQAGMNIDLMFIHLGVEYQSFFDTSKVTGKLALAF